MADVASELTFRLRPGSRGGCPWLARLAAYGHAKMNGMRSIRAKFLPCLVACATIAGATSYHVSPVGDDANPGSLDLPWRSFAPVAKAKLSPGDSVLLARGGRWRETLKIPASGTRLAPMVVAPYGPGTAMPEILGTETVEGGISGGARVARIDSLVKTVFADGEILSCSRWPDTGWALGVMRADTALSVATLAGADWTGASVHLVAEAWALETRIVKQGAGGTLVFKNKTLFHKDTVRFFLTNHANAMGARPSWSQSLDDRTLRWSSSVSAPIEAAVRNEGIDLRGRNWVSVQGIRVRGTAQRGLSFSGSGVRVEGCQFLHTGVEGIGGNGRESVVSGNLVRGASGAGISLGNAAATRVQQNTIRNTARMDWLGPDGMTLSAWGGRGILANGDSLVVRSNDIDSSGYSGLVFYGKNSLVDSNVVANSCLVTTDGGGIYTWTGRPPAVGSAGSVIRHNHVRDGRNSWTHGIYLDDGTHEVRVENNIVTGNVAGLFFHNNWSIDAVGNVSHANRMQMNFQHDTIAGKDKPMEGLRMERNILSSLAGQMSFSSNTYHGTTPPVIDWRDNRTCMDLGVEVGCQNEGGAIWRNERLADSLATLGPEILPNKGFEQATLGWTAWPTKARIAKDSSGGCGGGKCLLVRFSGDTASNFSYVYPSRTFPIEATWRLRLSFRARGGARGQSLVPALRRAHSDWKILGDIPVARLDTVWKSFVMVVAAKVGDSSSRLDFGTSATDSVYWIDDISLRTVPAEEMDSLAKVRLLVSLPSRIVPPDQPDWRASTWVDPSGARIEGPSFSAFQAVLAFPVVGGDFPRRGTASTPGVLRAFAKGGVLHVEGLSGAAIVNDIRGRNLTRMLPDPDGRASWEMKGHRGALWIRATEGVIAVFLPR
jgi:hypothetical protein